MHIIWKSGLIPFRLYQRKYLLSTPSPLHMISIDAEDIPLFLQTVKSIKKLLQHRQLKQFFSYFMLFTVTFSYFYLPVSFPIISRTGPVSLLTGEQTKQAIRQRKQSFAGTSQSPDIYHYSERIDKLISIYHSFPKVPFIQSFRCLSCLGSGAKVPLRKHIKFSRSLYLKKIPFLSNSSIISLLLM